MEKRSRRFALLADREVNRDSFIEEWADAGLTIMDSPNDPKPGICVRDGRIVEMDGRTEDRFDMIDRFIADHAIDPVIAEASMAVDSLEYARMLVDIHVPRHKIVRMLEGVTPAKLVDIVRHLNVVEMMMALQKLRVRRTTANQAHVTNRKEHPALLAADAAEAAWRGFAEEETTVAVSRSAPFNALSILVGSQAGRGGVLTQCAVEEAMSLKLAMKGFTSYAETLSVYGTEATFTDGDDTPWSKAFLASAYAGRGVKIRFTSGTGSEALMGHAEGKSMLYLEARCLMLVKGSGSQGVQNGSISCIALPESLPGGVRGVLAENLIATMLGLEVASGNDAMASHSDIRKTAKLMLQLLPGTDFITSGYSSMPRKDNLFGGGDFDAEDFDDWTVVQRDMQVDGGIAPATEEEVVAARMRGARAIQTVYAELGFPSITDEEVNAAVYGHASEDMPDRDRVADLAAAEAFLNGPQTIVNVIAALARGGCPDVAERLLEMQKQRLSGDYLQPAAIITERFEPLSGVNDPNDYVGPGSGYRVDGERWERLKRIPQARKPDEVIRSTTSGQPLKGLKSKGPAQPGPTPGEVVVALGPAFGTAITETLSGIPHETILQALVEGIETEGLVARIVKVFQTSDCGFIGWHGAQLSGSGIAIGMQSKGTILITKKGLNPLNNLELFGMSPNLTVESYRTIGRNAARYAKGLPVSPVPSMIDNMARLRYIVKTTLMHRRETECVRADAPIREMEFVPRA
ncbi:MAG: propanediol/glycerol family dehydratase large subunit [candidate division Zixibacteria bacterium]|nr:propanediol/glycerol family dehydratase large subunit [candidate division Zixibacteria bacterium]